MTGLALTEKATVELSLVSGKAKKMEVAKECVQTASCSLEHPPSRSLPSPLTFVKIVAHSNQQRSSVHEKHMVDKAEDPNLWRLSIQNVLVSCGHE